MILVNTPAGIKKQACLQEVTIKQTVKQKPFVAYFFLAGLNFKLPFYFLNPSLDEYSIMESCLLLMGCKERF